MSVALDSWQDPTEAAGGAIPGSARETVSRYLHSIWVRRIVLVSYQATIDIVDACVN